MITVTILTKNNEETLGSVLKSLKYFDEIVLLDTGSTDTTLEIAELYPNVRIFHSPFTGFGPLHNLAAGYATNDWILSIDSDEVLTLELAQELLRIKLDRQQVYSFPRKNYFNGKHIKWCGWYPDRIIRLYNKQVTSFTNDQVHEKVQASGLSEIKLQHPVQHYSYRSISDFLRKMEIYSNLFAEQNAHKINSSFTKALLHGFFTFIKSYIVKRGFLGGQEGYIISVYNAQTTFYKYLKLAYASHWSFSQNR